MKYIAHILLLLFSLCAQSQELTMLAELSSLQWKNRIIVANHVKHAEEALALFEKSPKAVQA